MKNMQQFLGKKYKISLYYRKDEGKIMMKEKVKEFIVKNLKWIILFICLIGFLAIAEDEFNKEITNPVQPTYPYKAKYIGKYIFENNCIRYLYKGESYEEDEMNCPGKLERILYHGDSDE